MKVGVPIHSGANLSVIDLRVNSPTPANPTTPLYGWKRNPTFLTQ